MRVLPVLVWVVVGLSRPDAGIRSPDAGAADAGRQPGTDGGTDAGLVSRWSRAEEAWFEGGYSDLIELSLDASVEVPFPRPIITTICDDASLVTLQALPEALRFTGVKPGVTSCGFWFELRPFPNRFVQVVVQPPEPP